MYSVPIKFQSGIVYKLNCKECNKYYNGQIKQMLKIRILAHTRQNTKYQRVVKTYMCTSTMHGTSVSHTFNIKEPKDWYPENILSKPLILKV